MYLVDTNIWLERLLGQDKSEVVGKFLDYVPTADLAISDFALHSIGVILSRLNRRDAFLEYIKDLFRKIRGQAKCQMPLNRNQATLEIK